MAFPVAHLKHRRNRCLFVFFLLTNPSYFSNFLYVKYGKSRGLGDTRGIKWPRSFLLSVLEMWVWAAVTSYFEGKRSHHHAFHICERVKQSRAINKSVCECYWCSLKTHEKFQWISPAVFLVFYTLVFY